MKEQDPNVLDIEVKGNPTRPLKENDPVLYVKDGIHYQGKIESFENGDAKLKIFNIPNIKEIIVPKNEPLQHLFVTDKNDKEVRIRFTYEEVQAALSNKNEVKATFPQGKNPFFNLMLGNKTEVLEFEKKIIDENNKEGKLVKMDGRLEVKRMSGTGLPYLYADVKFNELNLDRPIYGKNLDSAQKDQLKKTGELGLVSGFTNSEGKEYKLWVSLDKQLNKVVTKRENEIFVSKILGVTLSEKQLNEVRSGKGTMIEVKGKNYFVQPSASTTKADGIKTFTEEKAKEFKLIKEDVKNEKKNEKSKGVKL